MKHNARIHAQAENAEKQQAHKPSIQSKETATPSPAPLNRTGFQRMTPAEVLRMNGMVGNRAMSRMLGQRQEDDEELDYPGPRSKTRREDAAGLRGGAELRSSQAQRATPSSSATNDIGDAVDLDGEAMYGWDRTITASDVAKVVNGVIPTASSEEEFPRIVIFSGTHGDENGDLVNDNVSRGFVGEDQATANAVMAANPGIEVEVVDVVTSYATKDQLLSVYGMTDYIRVLGWCYSKRSYGLGDTLRSNWWPAPDNL